jgi:hypothetical protein
MMMLSSKGVNPGETLNPQRILRRCLLVCLFSQDQRPGGDLDVVEHHDATERMEPPLEPSTVARSSSRVYSS